jgi:hypothetical protein
MKMTRSYCWPLHRIGSRRLVISEHSNPGCLGIRSVNMKTKLVTVYRKLVSLRRKEGFGRHRLLAGMILLALVVCTPVFSVDQAASDLENTRIVLEKWIDTQRIISKERKDWQQGKEILAGRLDLAQKEVATIEEKTRQTQASVAEVNKKRSELLTENNQLKAAGEQLAQAVARLEKQIHHLFPQLPQPIKEKLQPLYQRVPEDPNKTRASVAERFQNVLGILNELNKANNEITISYEVHALADGKPSEVKAFYVGLAQAYYVSARGEAGVGHPTPDGWQWEPSKSSARDILIALDILQGKQSPAFVPLPMKMQ